MMTLPKGWGFPANSRKAHYFNNDSFSLCNKYGFFFGEAIDEHDDHIENCTECKRKKAKLDTVNAAKVEHGNDMDADELAAMSEPGQHGIFGDPVEAFADDCGDDYDLDVENGKEWDADDLDWHSGPWGDDGKQD